MTAVSTREEPVRFTIKYRPVDGQWQWVKDQFSVEDGQIGFQIPTESSKNLQDYLKNTDIHVQLPASAVPGGNAQIWPVKHSIAAAGEHACFANFKLGTPRAYTRWFCLVRQSRAWLCPRQGRPPFSLTEDAVLASFLLNNGHHLVLLAVSSEEILTVIKSDGEGKVVVSGRNDGLREGEMEIFASVATSFEDANAALMAHVKRVCTAEPATKESSATKENGTAVVETGTTNMEMWYDSLAYCTWNGLGRDLDEQKLLSALGTLSDNNIKLSTLIVDDNWQSLDHNGRSHFDLRWTEFEANQQGFPNGLKHTTKAIREMYPHVQNIAVWHGLLGYWNATSPHGGIARTYKTRLMRKQNDGFLGGGSITAVDADDVCRMYDRFYRYVKRHSRSR